MTMVSKRPRAEKPAPLRREASGFEAFYLASYAAVYRSVWACCQDKSTAEDAVQEAFAKALLHWRRVGGVPWRVGWVVTTAVRHAKKHQQRLQREHTQTDVSTTLNEPQSESKQDVLRALGLLPRRQRLAMSLYYFLDAPVSDVAQSMGISEGAVKAHLANGRARLRELLGPDYSRRDTE